MASRSNTPRPLGLKDSVRWNAYCTRWVAQHFFSHEPPHRVNAWLRDRQDLDDDPAWFFVTKGAFDFYVYTQRQTLLEYACLPLDVWISKWEQMPRHKHAAWLCRLEAWRWTQRAARCEAGDVDLWGDAIAQASLQEPAAWVPRQRRRSPPPCPPPPPIEERSSASSASPRYRLRPRGKNGKVTYKDTG